MPEPPRLSELDAHPTMLEAGTPTASLAGRSWAVGDAEARHLARPVMTTYQRFAWQLEKLGGKLDFIKRPIPEPRAGSALVNIESVLLPSYLQDYVEGRLETLHRA